jgi:C-terminal processing protease CtpA/Prc
VQTTATVKTVEAFGVIKAGYEQLQEEADKWEPYEVNLNRGTCGLGMSLEDQRGDWPTIHRCPPTSRVGVSAIIPGKPVAICGLVAVGDVLVGVNGRDVRGIAFDNTLELLKADTGSLHIQFKFLRKEQGREKEGVEAGGA